MTSRIPRALWRRYSCTGKARLSPKEARQAAASATRRTGETIRAYRCPHCGAHHVGHPPAFLGGDAA